MKLDEEVETVGSNPTWRLSTVPGCIFSADEIGGNTSQKDDVHFSDEFVCPLRIRKEWHGGSRLLFWRRPLGQHKESMQGYRVFVKKTLPKNRQPQPKERNKDIRLKTRKKLNTVRERGYIAPGHVESLTGYFSVPKGTDDIRMVYDAMHSGSNASLWAPYFGLPSVESLLREVNPTTWMGVVDIGEMFLNFCLDPSLQEYWGGGGWNFAHN